MNARTVAAWTTLFLVSIVAGCAGGSGDRLGHDGTEAGTVQAGEPAIDAVGAADEPSSSAHEAAEIDLPEIVRTAVTVAREIDADPDNSEAILKRHGLTLEAFEEMLYDISGDPELSQAYNAALN